MLELQNFIAKYQQLSKYRGVDPTNPVDFQIQPFSDGRSWTLICSFSEPTFARIPYNVLWMPVDGSLNPAKIYRRYDHETSTAPFASAWTEITAYADLWTEEQYYDPVLDDLNSYDIIDPYGALPVATNIQQGLTRLAPNPDNAPVSNVAIETTDERMSDPRYPNDHDHPDYPRSLIKINETQWARVNHAFPPRDGMLLFIEGVSPNDPNEFIAVWRYPHERDVGLVDRSLLYIEIRGDTSMLEQTSKTYTVWGVFADGVSRQVTPVTFGVTQNQAAVESFNSATGVLTAANIIDNETTRLSASYTFRGITRTAFRDIQIIAGAELVALRIVGADSIQSPNHHVYQVEAEFSDGTAVNVTPATFTSSNTTLTSVPSGTRVNTESTFTNGVTTLNATYTYDGTTLSATKEVQILARPDVPQSLQILGPNSIVERQTEEYQFLVTFSSGRQETRTSVTSFTKQQSETRITITAPNRVTAGDVPQSTSGRPIRLEASLTELGATVSATFNIDVLDVGLNLAATSASTEDLNVIRATLRTPTGVVVPIEEPLQVENWRYDPTTTVARDADYDFTPYATAFTTLDSDEASFATDRTSRVFDIFPWKRYVNIVADLDHPQYGPLTGSMWSVIRPIRNNFTQGAYDNVSGLVAVKIVPVGEDPATYNGATQADPYVLAEQTPLNLWYNLAGTWYKHRPKPRPTPPPNLPGKGSILNPCSTSIAHSRVSGPNENIILPIGFAFGNTIENLPEEFTIDAINPSADYVGRITFSMSYSYEVDLTIPFGQPGGGNPMPPVNRTTQFHYRVEHVSAPVTIEELRIRVDGGPDANASTHAEDQTLTLRYEARFSDAPAAWVDVTNAAELTAGVGAPAHGVTLLNRTDLILPDVEGNKSVTINASYTLGTTRTASYVVTITDENAPVLPTALRIRVVGGPNANASSHNENTSITLRYEAAYADAPSTWVDVTAHLGLTASLTAPLHGSVLTGKTDLALGEAVEGNKTLAITASLTDAGTTVNAGYTVTIVDTTVYLNAIRVRLASAPNAATNSSTINENQTVGLVYQAEYTDAPGTWVPISASHADLTVNLNPNSAGATLNSGRDQLTLPDVTGNQSVTVNASFTSGGRTRTGTYVLNVTDATVYLTAFRIRLASAPNAATNTSTHNENQTIAVVYQAQFSDAPSTWVDVSSNSLVTGAIVAPANGVTLSNKTGVVLPDVTGNQTATLRGTFAHPTGTQTADYIFNITDVVITPLELRIRLASAPTAPTNSSTHDENQSIELIYQARFLDNVSTWVNVNAHPGLNVGVASPAHGVTLNANKTTVNLPDVDGNKTVTLNASLVQNGTTVNASYTVNIVDTNAPTGPTPRWGIFTGRVAWWDDYGTPAFYDQLTNPLTGVSGQQITATTVANANPDLATYCFVLYPAAWGYLYVVNQSGNQGAFDGQSDTKNDAEFARWDPIMIGGVPYYVYRQQNRIQGTRTYTLTYGSSAPSSGIA